MPSRSSPMVRCLSPRTTSSLSSGPLLWHVRPERVGSKKEMVTNAYQFRCARRVADSAVLSTTSLLARSDSFARYMVRSHSHNPLRDKIPHGINHCASVQAALILQMAAPTVVQEPASHFAARRKRRLIFRYSPAWTPCTGARCRTRSGLSVKFFTARTVPLGVFKKPTRRYVRRSCAAAAG